MVTRLVFLFMVSAAAWMNAGCDDRAANRSGAANQANNAAAPTQWRNAGSAIFVPVPDSDPDPEMNAAIAKARSSAEQARQQWLKGNLEDRARWSIKWAAPTNDNHVEQVWVRPAHWSAFRIEGALESEPVAELLCGKSRGDLVGFPIEELSDWIHFTGAPARDAKSHAEHEGGFTVAVLEKRFGTPN